MKLTVKKTYGFAFINLVRHLLLSDTAEYRPIAFRVGNHSNVLAISDSVEEDMTEFISKFCTGAFVATSDEELVTVNLQCERVLSLSSVSTPELHFSGTDVDVLHSLNPVDVTVIFRKGTGNYSSDENTAFLEGHGFSPEDYVCVSSRHCLIENFSFTHEEQDDDLVFDISVVCRTGVNEKQLFSEIGKRLNELSHLLN